eukprot:6034856-Amphidinium_carterae.1
MLPELLSKVHEDSPRRWEQEKGVGSSPQSPWTPRSQDLHHDYAEQGVALSATSARELILAILRDSGTNTSVSTQWVRMSLKSMGRSYKVGDIRQQPKAMLAHLAPRPPAALELASGQPFRSAL